MREIASRNSTKPKKLSQQVWKHYYCHGCDTDGTQGVKLWRSRDTRNVRILCMRCVTEKQEVKIEKMGRNGSHKSRFGKTTEIGTAFVPAIPTDDTVKTFYGWNDAPSSHKRWWGKLPNK